MNPTAALVLGIAVRLMMGALVVAFAGLLVWMRWRRSVREEAERQRALAAQAEAEVRAREEDEALRKAMQRGDWLLWLDRVAGRKHLLPKERSKR